MSSTARLHEESDSNAIANRVNWRHAAFLTLRALKQAHLLDGSLVALIGSFARNAATWRSDVDIVVVTTRPVEERPSIPATVEAHFLDPTKLEARILAGDDYAQWIFRCGKLLHGQEKTWDHFLAVLEKAPWPEWTRKMNPAKRHLTRAEALLGMGDLDAACEQGLRAADLLARSVLLRAHQWPLSRPELADQMRALSERDLADALDTLGEAAPGRLRIASACEAGHRVLGRLVEERQRRT